VALLRGFHAHAAPAPNYPVCPLRLSSVRV
jgi:hypothetical protein